MNVCFKFHQDRSIFDRVIVIFVNSRWRQPPSWFLTENLRIRVMQIADVVRNLCFKFHEDRSNFDRVIAICVN